MSNTRMLHDTDKAARETIRLLSSLESVYKDLESCPGKRSRNSDYISYNAMHDSILPEGEDQNDSVKQGVDCVNVAIFTNAMWSNNGQYDEGIAIFFSLLVPKQLHDRDDVIDIFLDMVTIWAFAETRWPIGGKGIKEVISKMKERIEIVLKGEDSLLCQKIWKAFYARYEHDPMPWDILEEMVNPKRLKSAWFEVLPTVLDAIDNKEEGDHQQQAEENGSDNDAIENGDGSTCSFGTTNEGLLKGEYLDEVDNDDDEEGEEENTINNNQHHHESDVPESREGEGNQQDEPHVEGQCPNEDSGNVESASLEDTHELQHREEDFHVERTPPQTTTEPVELHLTSLESGLQAHQDVVYDDDQPNDSNYNDDDSTGWDIQGSDYEYHDTTSPMKDDVPSKRYHYDHGQRISYMARHVNAASSASPLNFSMHLLSPMDAYTVIGSTQEEGGHSVNQQDNRATPNASHAGMKRPHYQEEDGDGDDQAETRYRREPSFVSKIFGDDDGNANANIEDINPIRPPSHSNARRSTTSARLIVSVPQFNMLGSLCNHINSNGPPPYDDNNVHTKTTTREDEEYERHASAPHHHDNDHRITNLDPNPHTRTDDDAVQHSGNEMENGNTSTTSQQRQTPRHGLAYTTHYGPELPDDATQIGERDDTASGGCGEPTRDDVTQQQAVSGFGNTTRQQDDHTANNLSSTNTSATASPVSQRRRRRLRRRLQDIGPTIASTRPRRNNVAYTFPPMGQTFRRWTTEEVNALDDGIKLYGKQWGRIIAEYSILRTSKTKEQAARKARYIAKQRKLKGLPLEHYEGCG